MIGARRWSRRSVLLGLAALPTGRSAAGAPGSPRIATTELVLTQTALALGLPPVAAGNVPLYRRLVDEPLMPSGPADLGPLNEPNLELLQYLKPDLIFAASWQRVSQGALERIAPVRWLDTFALDGKPLANAFRLTERIGAEIGRDEQAATIVSNAKAAFQQARRHLADGPRKAVYIVRFLDDGRHLAVFGRGSLVEETFAEIGVENAWRGTSNAFGGAFVGVERLAERPDAVVLSFARTGVDPKAALESLSRNPLWRALPFVQDGRVIPLAPFFPAGGLPSAVRLGRAVVGALLQD